MAKRSNRKPEGKPKASNNSQPLRGKMLWALIGVIAIAAIVFFLGNAILQAIGFSFILLALWIIAIVWALWRRKAKTILGWWNLWLGAALFSLAIWGILSLIHPPLVIGSGDSAVRFTEVSLGGNAGEGFIGSQGAGVPPALRLALLFIGGMILVLPGPSFKLLKLSWSGIKKAISATLTGTRRSLPRLLKSFNSLYRRYLLGGMLAPLLAALRRNLRRLRRPEPEAGEEAVGEAVAPLSQPTETIEEKAPPKFEEEPQASITKKKKLAEAREPKHPPAALKQQVPPLDLLDKASDADITEAGNEQRARIIEEALRSYGVEAKVVQISPGPSVTQFGIEPGWDRKYRRVVERDHQGKIKLDKDGNPIERLEEVSKTRVKVERITALANNLALALATPHIRIEAPVPGKSLVGIEVPNTTTTIVRLRSVIESPSFQKLKAKTKLAIALGKGTAGEPVCADLGKMPHLLIAGATGSGKTVFINSTITCLLMHNSPRDMRLLLIDPKRVELVSFEGIPHLITPVVTESEKAIDALRRVLREMDNRYSKFSAVGARNIDSYNRSPLVTETMPYLIVIIDELAHLMMSAAEVVEPAICRLAQMSRATGIHLVVATQRPSVDVVTGLIKANFPTRISFAVASGVDSRTILDTVGAESLLGGGDMLYLPSDAPKPKRLRGCLVTDQEIDRVVSFWKQQREATPELAEDSVAQSFASLTPEEIKEEDPLLEAGRRLAKEYSHLSTSLLQRRLHIGYPRAARIMDLLEEEGTVVRHEHDKLSEAPELEAEEEGADDKEVQ